MLELIEKAVREQNKNVVDMALYLDGQTEFSTLIKLPPCQNCYSLSKSVISLGIGIAQDKGMLSVGDPITEYFKGELPDSHDPKLESVTIENLLTMSMGQDTGYLFEADRYNYPERDWVRLVLSRPLPLQPGEKFVYSNSCFYMLSTLLHRAVKMPVLDFLRDSLFDPLGIKSYAWEVCPKGEIMGATGLYMSTGDILKMGVMCFSGGISEAGERIVSSDYLKKATSVQRSDANYGWGFWTGDNMYMGSGAYSQIMLVVPSKKLVFAAHAYDNISYTDIILPLIGLT